MRVRVRVGVRVWVRVRVRVRVSTLTMPAVKETSVPMRLPMMTLLSG